MQKNHLELVMIPGLWTHILSINIIWHMVVSIHFPYCENEICCVSNIYTFSTSVCEFAISRPLFYILLWDFVDQIPSIQ